MCITCNQLHKHRYLVAFTKSRDMILPFRVASWTWLSLATWNLVLFYLWFDYIINCANQCFRAQGFGHPSSTSDLSVSQACVT